jgi:REP element-mobilizing transposase RayT
MPVNAGPAARPLRIIYQNAWYHVMNRGAAKKNIFYSDLDRLCFLKILNKIHDRYKIEIHAYCLMDNHYHLLVKTPLENLSQAIKYLNGTYAQRFNHNKKIDGPLFRGRFKAIVVNEDEYLTYLTRYIHLNPVKAGLCLKPWDYSWSSCKQYLGLTNKIPWLRTTEILKMLFGNSKYHNYASFLIESEDDTIKEKLLAHFPIFGALIVILKKLQKQSYTEINIILKSQKRKKSEAYNFRLLTKYIKKQSKQLIKNLNIVEK